MEFLTNTEYLNSQDRILYDISNSQKWLTVNSLMVTVTPVMGTTGVLYLTTLQLDMCDCWTSVACSGFLRCAFFVCLSVCMLHLSLLVWRYT